jgi:catechol 2,3-dioxygenase-like lactoylglutathione lyase family enzyme
VNIKTVNITFHVSDFKEAVSFYENVLGLQKKSYWPTYAVFDLCGIMLGLEPGRERGVKKGAPDIYLQVDNVDAVCEELKGKGVRFLTEPKDQSWGARTAKFEDPDGNTFILVQLKK